MSEEKTVRVLPFSGLKKDWRKWQAKFVAKARMRGFKKLLTGDEKVPKHDVTIDLTTEAGKKDKKLLEANETGFDLLMLSMQSEVCLALVQGAVTADQPDGCVHAAWTKLCKKFEPTSNLALTDLKREFNERTLTIEEDPDEWILDSLSGFLIWNESSFDWREISARRLMRMICWCIF